MNRVLFSLVSILLLSVASTSYGVVIGDFEGATDGWYTDQWTKGEITFSPIGATLNYLSLQVTAPGGWNNETKVDMKPYRVALGVKGTTITADVTAFAADLPGGTRLSVEMVINAEGDGQSGPGNKIGWKSIASMPITMDGQPHKYTWEIPDDLAAAIALTDGNIWWFELALASDTDGTATKFYIDNIQLNDPAKKIVFVSSMHPSTADANVPSDQGFVDLLVAAGYKVDYQKGSVAGTGYWEGTLDPNKVAVLDDADLVIIGRDCNSSGVANTDAQRAAWNAVKSPIMLMSSYIAANNRFKWLNSSSQDARKAYYDLKAVDPNLSLFEGVTLDPNNVVKWYDPNAASGFASFINTADAGSGRVLAVRPDNGNILIAVWDPNVETYVGSGQIPVDVRMFFNAGTQEISSQKTNWGVMNLNAEGQKIFLNAVNYLVNPPLPPAVNLLANGGFEDGTLTGWNIYGAATGTVVTELVGATVADGPIEGTYCLYVDVPAKTANFWDAGLQPQGIKFEKDKKYTFSVFMKSKAGSLEVNMKPEKAADPWTAYGEKMMTITEEWQEYSVTTPVFPADVAPAGFTFHIGNAVGGFWVDGMRYYEGDYVKP